MEYFEYPASVNHFRAFMEAVIFSFDDGIWVVDDKRRLMIRYQSYNSAPARECWSVVAGLMDESSPFLPLELRATIMALEELPNKCTIHVHDGCIYAFDESPIIAKYERIGKPLEDFLDILTSRMTKQLMDKTAILRKPFSRNLDEWFRYYDDCKRAGKKFTLKDIVKEAEYSYGYVRHQHRRYTASR